MSEEPLSTTIAQIQETKEKAVELNGIVKRLKQEVSRENESVVVDDPPDSNEVHIRVRMAGVTQGLEELARFGPKPHEIDYDMEKQVFKKHLVFRTT